MPVHATCGSRTGLRGNAKWLSGGGPKFKIPSAARSAGSGKYMNLLAYRGHGGFATEVTMTGRFFSAEEALAAGVIDRVAPAGKHIEVARELAATINKNPPLAVRASVMQRRWQIEDNRREALRYQGLNKLYPDGGLRGGDSRVREKRKPKGFKAR